MDPFAECLGDVFAAVENKSENRIKWMGKAMNPVYHPHGSMSLSSLARSIAIEAEVVKGCDAHPYSYLKTSKDFEKAYQLSETLIEIGLIEGVEHSLLHYAIEQFLREEVDESCPECGARCGEAG